VGFSPDGGWTAILPELIGNKRTAEILMENRTISAEEAVAWGIANRIIDRGEIEKTAFDIAHEICEMHPASIRDIKKLLSPELKKLAALLDEERRTFIENIKERETQERMIAFLEKMKS
jgi:2-(1,2-epoxy-1,2-dihydrophenyl)acetyl-CoA isomerase